VFAEEWQFVSAQYTGIDATINYWLDM